MSEQAASDDDFGDFQEVVEEDKPKMPVAGKEMKKPVKKKQYGHHRGERPREGDGPVRVKKPREGEFVGLIVQRYGGNRMEVQCNDGKVRNGRVPGRYRRKLWLRPGDFVIVVPWEDNDEKADVVFKYQKNQKNALKKAGLVNDEMVSGF